MTDPQLPTDEQLASVHSELSAVCRYSAPRVEYRGEDGSRIARFRRNGLLVYVPITTMGVSLTPGPRLEDAMEALSWPAELREDCAALDSGRPMPPRNPKRSKAGGAERAAVADDAVARGMRVSEAVQYVKERCGIGNAAALALVREARVRAKEKAA